MLRNSLIAMLIAAPAAAQAPPVKEAPRRSVTTSGVTPNAQRVAEIAAIDKRTGEQRIFKGSPGERFDFGALRISLRTCETAPPWEARLSGAFLQIDESGRSGVARVFSGWMFAESPSLNPLEHPRYDVWVRSCAMRWPDRGPDTVVVESPSRSSAAKSATPPSAEASEPL